MHIIANYTRAAAQEVFTKMLDLPLTHQEGPETEVSSSIDLAGVIGTVGFTGKMSGLLYLCMSESLALQAAGRIVGGKTIRPEDVNDVIAELTNMVTGNLKSKMMDRGFSSVLSIPTVMRSAAIQVASLQAALTISIAFDVPAAKEVLRVYVLARLEE